MNSLYEKVADGLAQQGYAIIDPFLSHSERGAKLEIGDVKGGLVEFKKGGVGKERERKINETIRGDYVQWIDRPSAGRELKVYLDKLDTMISYINRTLFLSLKDFEVHLTLYPSGSGYTRPLDQFRGDDHRRLSVILYLNEGWKEEEGGQLRLHLPGGPIDVFPIAGRLVCFRSDKIEHEVMPATRDRLSITGWVLDQLAELKYL